MNEAAQGIFGCGHAEKGACAVGETLRQTDLAQVLESISKRVPMEFIKVRWLKESSQDYALQAELFH